MLKTCRLSVLLMLTLSLIGFSTNSAVGNTSPIPTTCTSTVLQHNIVAAGEPVSQQDAVTFAQTSEKYKSATTNYEVMSFQGANDGWSFNSNCQVSWQVTSLSFLVKAGNESLYILTVSENPSLKTVYSATIGPLIYYSPIQPQCNISKCLWSGYGIAGDSNNPHTQQIFEAQAYWYQWSATPPPTSEGDCSSTGVNHCHFSSWVGLTATTAPSSSATIVQGGTAVDYFGPRTIPAEYNAWTEFFPTLPVNCTNFVPHVGDLMEGTSENQYAINGVSNSTYHIFVTDWTSLHTCSAKATESSWTPIFGLFMGEGPNYTASSKILADFSDFNFTDCAYYTGSFTGVYSAYNNGWGYGVYMHAGTTDNTQTYAMSQVGNGYGTFKLHWKDSTST